MDEFKKRHPEFNEELNEIIKQKEEESEGPKRIETRIVYLMIDQNGRIIKELNIDELRKETSGEKEHDNN